jgi:hypothetical protein
MIGVAKTVFILGCTVFPADSRFPAAVWNFSPLSHRAMRGIHRHRRIHCRIFPDSGLGEAGGHCL